MKRGREKRRKKREMLGDRFDWTEFLSFSYIKGFFFSF